MLKWLKSIIEYFRYYYEEPPRETIFVESYFVTIEFDIQRGGSLCVYLDNEEIAKADMHFEIRKAELKRIKVNEEYRLKGIGSLVIDIILKWCKEHQIKKVKVYPSSYTSEELFEKGFTKALPQKHLIAFYKKCGFTEEKGDYLYANIG